jgi:hypothetical protein
VLEVDEGPVSPDRAAEILARHQLAGTRGQQVEHPQRLGLHAKAQAGAPQLAGGLIQLEGPEAEERVRHGANPGTSRPQRQRSSLERP